MLLPLAYTDAPVVPKWKSPNFEWWSKVFLEEWVQRDDCGRSSLTWRSTSLKCLASLLLRATEWVTALSPDRISIVFRPILWYVRGASQTPIKSLIPLMPVYRDLAGHRTLYSPKVTAVVWDVAVQAITEVYWFSGESEIVITSLASQSKHTCALQQVFLDGHHILG